eukprot:15284577-Heterocapsa_arctica.AAC.1
MVMPISSAPSPGFTAWPFLRSFTSEILKHFSFPDPDSTYCDALSKKKNPSVIAAHTAASLRLRFGSRRALIHASMAGV